MLSKMLFKTFFFFLWVPVLLQLAGSAFILKTRQGMHRVFGCPNAAKCLPILAPPVRGKYFSNRPHQRKIRIISPGPAVLQVTKGTAS